MTYPQSIAQVSHATLICWNAAGHGLAAMDLGAWGKSGIPTLTWARSDR